MNALLLTDNAQDEAILSHALRLAGLQVNTSQDIKTALHRWIAHPADLLLVALHLQDATAAVREIRRVAIVPLILIIEPGGENLHVNLVQAGVDWVIERPYNVRYLIAYTQALLRRSNEVARDALPSLRHEMLHLDPGRRTVQLGSARPQRLSQLEFRLLHTLMVHKGQVLPTDIIVEHVWGYTGEGDRSLVRGLINRLRVKIETDPNNPTFICTVPRVGYIFGEDTTD